MILIDGAKGGGQIFRSSLTLSIRTGHPVKIINIRGKRQKPGLLRQHLTCLKAAKAISNAQVEGDYLGSQEVLFSPGPVQAGEYHFAIGSAGSSTLVFQTIFPALAFANTESHLTLEGGTHNDLAPSVDFIEHCFKASAKKIGYNFSVELERYGFNPAGGGHWKSTIIPVKDTYRFECIDRGQLKEKQAIALSSKLPRHVAERELNVVEKQLKWQQQELRPKPVDSAGPGNLLSLRMIFDNSTEMIEVVGAKRASAEKVAQKAIDQVARYEKSGAAIGEHLADQLVLIMALSKGGQFTTCEPSDHLLTNIEVIKAFLPVEVELQQEKRGLWTVTITI